MLYGADIFLNPTSAKTRSSPTRAILSKLRTIQRRAALAITGAMSSTPTDALDVYANLLPVQYLVEKARYGAAMRLATLPATHPLYKPVANAAKRYVKRHHTPLHELMAEFEIKPGEMEKMKSVRFAANWESSLAVEIRSSKEEAIEAEEADKARWKVYSDRSGIDRKIGAAAVLFRDGKEIREGVGGSLGMELLRKEVVVAGAVSFFVDSKPAIQATESPASKPSHYIWDWLH
ncbi:hypothetical protein C8R44DRAFT_710815, partial [Mycena epipterygia]